MKEQLHLCAIEFYWQYIAMLYKSFQSIMPLVNENEVLKSVFYSQVETQWIAACVHKNNSMAIAPHLIQIP